MLIDRSQLIEQLAGLLKSFRAVERVGPRQVGKTTLARHFIDVTSPVLRPGRPRLWSAPNGATPLSSGM